MFANTTMLSIILNYNVFYTKEQQFIKQSRLLIGLTHLMTYIHQGLIVIQINQISITDKKGIR